MVAQKLTVVEETFVYAQETRDAFNVLDLLEEQQVRIKPNKSYGVIKNSS